VLAPVAPHNLFSRPIVLRPDSTIELEVLADRPAHISVDGQDQGVVGSGEGLVIRRGDSPALLVTLDDGGFAAKLASNLGIPPE
jgi:NAD+ kinase